MARSVRTMAEPTTETMSTEEEIRHLELAMDSGDTSGQPAVNPEAKQREERKKQVAAGAEQGPECGEGQHLQERQAVRLHLFNSMMQSWKQRVETVHNSEPAKAGALLMGIVKEEPAANLLWNYLKWDWDTAHLVVDEREPLTHMQVMEHLSNILQSCEAPGAILF